MVLVYSSVQGNFRPPQGTVAVPLTLVLVLSVKLPVCGAVMNKLHQAVYGAGECVCVCVCGYCLYGDIDVTADQNVQHLTGPHVSHLLLTEKGLTGDTSRDQHHHTVVSLSSTPPPSPTSSSSSSSLVITVTIIIIWCYEICICVHTCTHTHACTQYLPGEVHHFDISIPSNPSPDARGMLLPHSKVPFLHPVQVTAIISVSCVLCTPIITVSY